MNDYTALPDPEAEQTIFDQMHAYDESQRMSYAQIGLMAIAVDKRMLWKHRQDPADGFPCRSFARWIRMACPYAYSTVYRAMGDVEALPEIEPEDIAQIPYCNFSTMRSLSSSVRRDPDVLEAAKERTGLVAYVREKHPDQHLPDRKLIKVMVDDPDLVYSVLDQAVELHDAIDRGHALEMVCAMARKSWELQAEVDLSIQMEAER